jgi:nucleotide-binding universal stress UspA family protein
MSSRTSHPADTPTNRTSSCLLVPLDGSERAALALPVAAAIAEATHTPLLLARITPFLGVPPVAAAGVPLPADMYQQPIDDERRLALDYLDEQAESLRKRGLTVETFVAHGDPAAILLDLAADYDVSLIVMTTHGRTGFARFALGSVADRLIHYGHLPILLLRTLASGNEQRQQPAALLLDCVLVPLDGSTLAEAALEYAVELAGTLVHRITLVRVVPYTAKRAERLEAAEYLEAQYRALHDTLAGRDCLVDILLLEGTMPGEAIAHHAAEKGSLVIMATHRRAGITRWILGSVAAQVVHSSHVPVLLVHPVPDALAIQQPTDPMQSETELASTLPQTAPLRPTARRSTLENTAHRHERVPAALPLAHRD